MSFTITEVDRLPGGHDDGTTDGVLRTKAIEANLVKVPLTVYGSSNADHVISTVGGGTSTTSNNVTTNGDGTGTAVTLTAPAVTSSVLSSVYLEKVIYGPKVGVRFRRNNSSSLVPFTVWVDGVPYAVRNVNSRRHAQALTLVDGESLFLIADDLGPGPHTVRVSLAGAPIGGASRSLTLYGFLADRSAGYEDRRRFGMYGGITPTVLPSSAAAIPTTSAYAAVRKLAFHNTSGATRTVTITVGTDIYKVLSIPTLTSAEIDFGDPIVLSSSWKWNADAAASVNGWVQEAN